jgi:hypothetical protein
MVTKGLTKKQREFGVQPRIRFTKGQIKMFEKEHRKLVEEDLRKYEYPDEDDVLLEKFETYYLGEYNSFSKPFILTRRIKEFQAGKKIIYDYQVVYKTAKGRNAPSPVRAYIQEVHQKIRDMGGANESVKSHLEKHLDYAIYKKHTDSLKAYIKSKKEKGEIE